jgi:3'(2'), 5'-bisphosphate nucleotidase
MDFLIEPLKKLSYLVGHELLNYYQQVDTLAVTQKSNDTPVTLADTVAHQMIFDYLQALMPNIPILSEEGETLSFAKRQAWERYWLIDPLDGTKEFLAKTGEFSVNIALIENHKPILGFVYAPVLKTLYYAYAGLAYKITDDGIPVILRTQCVHEPLRIAVSRHHQGSKLQAFLSNLAHFECVIMGSALKLCLVAEGAADLYLRLGPTSEWDTAAGQYIVECAGGQVVSLTGEILGYNQKDSLRNPQFLAFGDKTYDWKSFLSYFSTSE